MKRRKQNNRDMLERHRAEYQRNLDTIARLIARNEELVLIITEEENVEYIALARSTHMELDEFQRFLEGRRENGVPFPMNENTNEQEDMQHEA